MNRYKFIVSKPANASAIEIANAKELTDVNAILSVAKCIGEYVFNKDEKLTEIFSKANSVALTIETLPNGAEINRAIAILSDGSKYRLRVYGSKELQPAKNFSKEEISQLRFGVCTSDGAKVTETRLNSESGEILRVPVIYVNLA